MESKLDSRGNSLADLPPAVSFLFVKPLPARGDAANPRSGPVIRAIDHINIVVADLERSVAFYTEVLGFAKQREAVLEGEWIDRIVGLQGVKGRVVYVVAPAGEPRIELLCYDAPAGLVIKENSRANTVGLRHIALRVDDLAALVKRLRAAGATVFGDPVRVPHGVVRHDAGEKTLVYFLDPDGVILELAEYR